MTLQRDLWTDRRGYHNIPAFSLKSAGIISTFLTSPLETICMKCQNLISWKNKKKVFQYVVC